MQKRLPEREDRQGSQRSQRRIKRTVGKEELRHFKIVLNPIPLTPAESKARMEQLYILLFSPLKKVKKRKKELDFSSKKEQNK